MNPGDTRSSTGGSGSGSGRAQRRPGRESRRHSFSTAAADTRPAPLNEGRDVNPGDTWNRSGVCLWTLTAQRRPGRESRRHSIAALQVDLEPPRSTKAGT